MGHAHGDVAMGASHEPSPRTAAFRPLRRPTAESARKQPKGCGPRSFRFKGHGHGPEAKRASPELDGRAALPRSRSSVDAAVRQHRSSGVSFLSPLSQFNEAGKMPA
ncbi:MAG: hypothetical protein FJ398_07180 [Verrucomicrobia bacterium]|nr:hypothetical protein [Verrucomicrobiota bacterium]